MFLYLSKILPLLLYPLGLSLVLMLAALLLLRLKRYRQVGWLCAATFLLLGVFSAPVVSQALLASLEDQYPDQTASEAPKAEVIVVLGGAIRLPNEKHQAIELDEGSDRVLHAARLFKAGKAPLVLMSGGNVPYFTSKNQLPEAALMGDLAQEFGVPPGAILLETRSFNTHENAAFSKELLLQRGLRRVLLVTSAFHMPRSVAIFRREGFEVIPASTDFRSGEPLSDPVLAVLPNARAMESSVLALKEWIGLLVYRLRGWA